LIKINYQKLEDLMFILGFERSDAAS